jgi:hypothetical protein
MRRTGARICVFVLFNEAVLGTGDSELLFATLASCVKSSDGLRYGSDVCEAGSNLNSNENRAGSVRSGSTAG